MKMDDIVTTIKNNMKNPNVIFAKVFNISGDFLPAISLEIIIIGPRISKSITHTIAKFSKDIGTLESNFYTIIIYKKNFFYCGNLSKKQFLEYHPLFPFVISNVLLKV
jgi:hypothetical protein